MAYSKGSQWHRWDLHLHTPETKKNDCYEGRTPADKWDKFYKYINAYLNRNDESSDIIAIGITDYCSITNYKKVVAAHRLPDYLFLLPNVEMRLCVKSGDKPINIHFLFDPAYIDEVEDEFFSDLKFTYNSNTFNATEASLEKLGKEFNRTRDKASRSDYETGLDRFVPSLDSFSEVFKNHPKLREHTLIGIANSSNDGASGIRGETLSAYRDSLYQFCDFIFSSFKSDRNYFLGQSGKDDRDQIIKRYGSLMPCLHGSDAHELKKIFEPDDKRYCWIKAEPTFNGLRQVLYEPKSRVVISEEKPEIKRDYQIIDSIQFNDSNFDNMAIPFNANLNCIIGGRSTGKTCLLHNLSNTIDQKQTAEREQDVTNASPLTINAKVKWSDGSQDVTNSHDSKHKIMYIPQSYLNRLSEESSYGTINEMIEPIVLSNESNAIARETMNRHLETTKKTIHSESFKFKERIDELQELKNEMSEIGTEEGIRTEKEKLEKQINVIRSRNNISAEDVETYSTAQDQVHKLENDLLAIRSDKDLIEAANTLITKAEPWPTLRVQAAKEELDKAWEEIVQESKQIWRNHKAILLSNLAKSEKDSCDEQKKAQNIVSRLKPAIDKTTELKSLSKRLAEETGRLEAFLEKKQRVNDIELQISQILEILNTLRASFENEKRKYADIISTAGRNSGDANSNVILSAEVSYEYGRLASIITDYVDGRKLRSRKELRAFIEESKEGINPKKYPWLSIQRLINDSINDKSLIKGSVDQFISALFDDYTVIKYKAALDGDELARMSPGKKALVYLKLLIELDSSKSPILIDQPEDDLDNRSIFTELIPFLKDKKRYRQMIIVTHNANVVLGADAEEIIVSNQAGEGSPNLNNRFEYISGAIEDNAAQDSNSKGVLQRKSIEQHICEILEGGSRAFEMRRRKYATLFD